MNYKSLKLILEEENLNITKNPNGTDKGDVHPYVDEVYEKEFIRFQDKDITLVEIGIRGGSSIHLWKKYFKNAKKIYGLDNNETVNDHPVHYVNEEWVSGNNVKCIYGDAYTEEISNKIKEKIDIFIDDGPHTIDSHIKSIEFYLPKMNESGLFIIEDILYDANQYLYDKIPENIRDFSKLYDFENVKMLVIDFSK